MRAVVILYQGDELSQHLVELLHRTIREATYESSDVSIKLYDNDGVANALLVNHATLKPTTEFASEFSLKKAITVLSTMFDHEIKLHSEGVKQPLVMSVINKYRTLDTSCKEDVAFVNAMKIIATTTCDVNDQISGFTRPVFESFKDIYNIVNI